MICGTTQLELAHQVSIARYTGLAFVFSRRIRNVLALPAPDAASSCRSHVPQTVKTNPPCSLRALLIGCVGVLSLLGSAVSGQYAQEIHSRPSAGMPLSASKTDSKICRRSYSTGERPFTQFTGSKTGTSSSDLYLERYMGLPPTTIGTEFRVPGCEYCCIVTPLTNEYAAGIWRMLRARHAQR